jgi:two-component system, NarL family, nitrate/nitrite response regulator NarL
VAAADEVGAAIAEVSAVELSKRETEVLELLAAGLTNREVAGRLDISVRTAEFHRDNIRAKLDASSRAELVAHARTRGLWKPDVVDA